MPVDLQLHSSTKPCKTVGAVMHSVSGKPCDRYSHVMLTGETATQRRQIPRLATADLNVPQTQKKKFLAEARHSFTSLGVRDMCKAALHVRIQIHDEIITRRCIGIQISKGLDNANGATSSAESKIGW